MGRGLLDYFPSDFSPSKNQKKLITEIQTAFDDGYKFVVCSAPTGSGKSFISKTLGNASRTCDKEKRDLFESYQVYKRNNTGGYQFEDELESSQPHGMFALTITKALQDQYKDLFSDVDVLKGKSNYQCTYDTDYSVEYAPCIHLPKLKEKCWSNNTCPYYLARNRALVSSFSTLSYNMFFALPAHTKRRQYIVCDEASELEDQLVKEFTCKVNFDILKKHNIDIPPFPSNQDYGKIGRWLNTLCISIEEGVGDIKNFLNKPKTVSERYVIERKNDLISLIKIQNKIKTLLDTWYDSEYLFERESSSITFTPLKVNQLARKIFDYADNIVLMSATIIDPKSFCKTLGIDKFKYIEAESTFDPKNAPIYCSSKVKLNYNNLQKNLPSIAKIITDICNHHANEKGIIHTQTNAITTFLQKSLKGSRFLFREPGIKNEDILSSHSASTDPTVLVSPSMTHGVDLRDNLARFQIIVKAPYLPITDKRIERLMKSDFNWYQNKMLSSLIQACGRGIRSSKDHCTTYILDAAIIEALIKERYKMPKYFIDRFL